MYLTDTHTHIYLPEFDADRDEVVGRALKNDVKVLLMPNIDTRSLDAMNSAAERYKGVCYCMAGLHPTSVNRDFEQQLKEIGKVAGSSNYVAIGEIGIDLYWDKTFINEQITAFRRQLWWALEMDLPAVIHSRNAFEEIFKVIDEFRGTGLKGVFHAFSGDTEIARKAISMGFMIGIGGIVTFKNSGLAKVVKEVGAGALVLETDSPYLAPAPYRGKRNESSYLTLINARVAEILGMKEEATAEITTENAMKIFKLNG